MQIMKEIISPESREPENEKSRREIMEFFKFVTFVAD